ncbi:hypothetical protein [Desulfonatronum thioautotrophicum]|uniref:hypothetical protein n=1 Tax=Desulfonatronum thioautotrophicum TaxID=617001 RepID=UPI0005EB9395|nr:hypothetical protein [Desulfonatronum thioautotrophicum]
MEDARGLYYYPVANNTKERMYVRERAGNVEFRLWNMEKPQVWEQHDWLPYDVIEQAAAQYSGGGASPLKLYDLDIALTLIREQRLKKAQAVKSPSS